MKTGIRLLYNGEENLEGAPGHSSFVKVQMRLSNLFSRCLTWLCCLVLCGSILRAQEADDVIQDEIQEAEEGTFGDLLSREPDDVMPLDFDAEPGQIDSLGRRTVPQSTGSSAGADSDTEDRIEIKHKAIVVKGCGIWGNRMLKKVVWMLLPPAGSRPEFLNSPFIEDAVYMLQAELEDDGYLYPSMDIDLELVSGEILNFAWERDALLNLPRGLQIRKVIFHVNRGVRFHYEDIQFFGLQAIPIEEAETYFKGLEFLIKQKSSRIYSPSALTQSVENLEEALRRMGYVDVEAKETSLVKDPTTGGVRIKVTVNEGPLYRVVSTRETIGETKESPKQEIVERQPNVPYSRYWLSDWVQEMRARQFRKGYPKPRVVTSPMEQVRELPDLEPPEVHVALDAVTEPGLQYVLGDIGFDGHKKTRERFMRRRTRLHSGDLLNPLEVQAARYRLARTGLFDSVQFTLEEPEIQQDPPAQNVEFQLVEGKYSELNVLAGYGTWELLRGGIEWEKRNLFGRAHSSRLRLVQAVRATRAQYDYSIPGLFNTPTDGFASIYARQRDEPAFRRRETGGSIGVDRPIESIYSRIGLRYTYEYLDAGRLGFSDEFGVLSARAASLSLNLIHDRRDNSMSPQEGYHLFTRGEVASSYLGGQVNYQLAEFGGSYHRPIGNGQFLHFGFRHGIVRSQGDRRENLPFNKRFFPGGENSIRGYQLTEASSRDAQGSLVGSETFWLVSAEFEQGLTPAWSIVFFSDTVGIAADLGDYPYTEVLASVGIGIRWKTVIGPIRLEYGHNLNPRQNDPSGTVLFSIGFPF